MCTLTSCRGCDLGGLRLHDFVLHCLICADGEHNQAVGLPKMVSGYQGGKEKQGMGGAQFADDSRPNNKVNCKSALN